MLAFVAIASHWLCVLLLLPVVICFITYTMVASYLSKRAAAGQIAVSDAMPHEWASASVDMSEVGHYSTYVNASDGTRLAVDVWLPAGADQNGTSGVKVPCVFHQTRYYRSTRTWWPLSRLINNGKPLNFICDKYFKAFLARGIAIVSYDVRGSGASFGAHRAPWVQRERMDSDEVLEWMCSCAWFNGNVGLWGISYEAVAAYHTALRWMCVSNLSSTHDHSSTPSLSTIGSISPQVRLRVCAPFYAFWDAYSELGFPGGVRLHCFSRNWYQFTRNLDRHTVWLTGLPAFILFRSVTPVEPDVLGLWNQGLIDTRADRINWNPLLDLPVLDTRDQQSSTSGLSAEDISLYSEISSLVGMMMPQANTPLDFIHVTGWYDTSVICALKSFLYTKIGASHMIIIGPWTHGGNQHVKLQPNTSSGSSQFPFADFIGEMFAQKLHDSDSVSVNASSKDVFGPNKLAYFVVNENVWRFVPSFPFDLLQTGKKWYLTGITDSTIGYRSLANSPDRPHYVLDCLSKSESPTVTHTLLVSPSDKGSIGVSRWRSMTDLFTPVSYDMDASSLNHIRFTSAPLDKSIEVTGFPLVTLNVSTPVKDATVFVYIECVDVSGNASYVTEGCIRVCFHELDGGKGQHHQTSVNQFPIPHIPQRTFTRANMDDDPLVEPRDITFELQPISFMFFKDQRIRVALCGADIDNFGKHETAPHPINFHFGPNTHVTLPIAREVQES